MHLKPLAAILAVSLLTLPPALPMFDLTQTGVAHAKGEGGGNGNGNGNGNGKSDSKSAEKGKSDAKKSKSAKATTDKVAKKPKKATAEVEVVKGKPVEEGELRPNELGKMNGAMNANINAVLAHIRNGQVTNGPVGLLAGLAVADAGAGAAGSKLTALTESALAFDELDAGLQTYGFENAVAYLQAKQDGTVTAEEMAVIDPLIDAAGGTTDDGLALAETKPTAEEIAAAEEEAAAATEAVAGAEQAIGDAWNKDGDLQTLLTELRAKLEPHQDAINAAVTESSAEEEAALLLEDALVIE